MLLLTNCAACARTLEQDSKRCGNCKTPFCNAVCQKVAWKRGGHKAVCGTIADGGAHKVLVSKKKCAHGALHVSKNNRIKQIYVHYYEQFSPPHRRRSAS